MVISLVVRICERKKKAEMQLTGLSRFVQRVIYSSAHWRHGKSYTYLRQFLWYTAKRPWTVFGCAQFQYIVGYLNIDRFQVYTWKSHINEHHAIEFSNIKNNWKRNPSYNYPAETLIHVQCSSDNPISQYNQRQTEHKISLKPFFLPVESNFFINLKKNAYLRM